MFRKISNGCVKVVQRFLPDAFIFCIILTIVVFVAAIPVTGAGPLEIVGWWGKNIWSLLAFSMQMALILVLGTALADAPAVKALLKKLASIPKTPFSAIFLVTIVSALAMWFNWGFGLVVGALFAKEIARAMKKIDYRILIASAYSVIAIWHAGFSGSIPLQIANVTESVTAQTAGVLVESIPISQTIFAPWNVITIIIGVLVMAFANAKMHPEEKDVVAVDPSKLVEVEEVLPPAETPAQKMEQSVALSMITGLLGVAYLVQYFMANGMNIDLNVVNLICLSLGILLHKRPISYVNAIGRAAKGSAGVLLQFPFYAGIMGIMVGAPEGGTSLAAAISNVFVSISTVQTFPLWTFLSAGIVNFFVPSGGGQWTVQAPIVLPAAQQLGASYALSCMAIAWGDAWTNLLQPFWALPALGIAGLGARDIMGYCVIDLIIVGIIVCIAFLVAGTMGF